ncbi:MAG: hypothetical protein R2704_03465 [Microthrixaceae bacterium]
MSPHDRPARRPRVGVASPCGLALVVLGLTLGVAGCGGSDQRTVEDFERIVIESEASNVLGPEVAGSYARCLYRETDGRVEVLIEHLDDPDYQPEGPEADAVAACSNELIDADGN